MRDARVEASLPNKRPVARQGAVNPPGPAFHLGPAWFRFVE